MKTENQTPEQQPENHAGIYQALANFQYDCPTIPKMKKGYGYNYAELSKTVELIKPPDSKNAPVKEQYFIVPSSSSR